jgi:hypothetical protein
MTIQCLDYLVKTYCDLKKSWGNNEEKKSFLWFGWFYGV